jgi:hypothetical protein
VDSEEAKVLELQESGVDMPRDVQVREYKTAVGVLCGLDDEATAHSCSEGHCFSCMLCVSVLFCLLCRHNS